MKDFLSKHQRILNAMFLGFETNDDKKQDQNWYIVRDFQKKQQQDLELIHKSLLDLKQSTAGNRLESDDLASDYQNKQQEDLEVIKQSLLDLKQCATSSRAESDVLDSLSSDDEREPMNRKRKRTNKDSGKRKD